MASRFSLLAYVTCILSGLALAPTFAWSQQASSGKAVSDFDRPLTAQEWGVLVFGGEMSNHNFENTLSPIYSQSRENIYFAGAAINRRIRDGRYIDVELEGGGGYQFADGSNNDSGQIWAALYFRYDRFPWNRFIYTTVAISTGLNYSFNKTAFEENEDHNDGTRRLLHYLSPEITFAHPDHKQWQGVLRLHHRSGVYGLLGCNHCGSNMVTAGVRRKF